MVSAAEQFALPFYAQPQRAYHNVQHVRYMLQQLQQRQVYTPHLALATWGHDLIYDARASNNEEQSAAQFGAWLHAYGATPEVVQSVQRLILATKHQSPPQARDEALLVDADLSILGAPADSYAQYERAIRLEYQHVPRLLYMLGRAKVLRQFLKRPSIYSTPEFADLEKQARHNLRWALRLRTIK